MCNASQVTVSSPEISVQLAIIMDILYFLDVVLSQTRHWRRLIARIYYLLHCEENSMIRKAAETQKSSRNAVAQITARICWMGMKIAWYWYCSNSHQEILLYRLAVLRVRGSTMWLLRLENVWRANGLLKWVALLLLWSCLFILSLGRSRCVLVTLVIFTATESWNSHVRSRNLALQDLIWWVSGEHKRQRQTHDNKDE